MGVPGEILCILMLLLHKSSQQNVFNDKATLNLPENDVTGWMEALNDDTLISEITIPGTHESLALYGGLFAECQAWRLEDQLKAGIRYFDLRVSGNKLKIVHGWFGQKTSLPEVVIKIRNFFKEFKREVVLLRVKPVSNNKESVLNLVKILIGNSTDIWVQPSFPRIGEVRGKIVFVQKNSFTLGITLSETDEKGDYKVTKVTVKEEKIKKHLEEAAGNCRAGANLSLSYSSGTSLGTYMPFHLLPKKLAKEINPWLYDHLTKELKKNPKPCFGIIAMDFPGIDLIQIIIKFNTPS
ncbi:1-phosphatidylinositol phosphodiesterase-like [Pseudorasbora parva]|uniref:1-phosphatidylinositol phosphodiesterase-like n=1 Tax=Pseudorasbora parva TaxID=51549 RepID=UPI00351E4211